MTSLTPVQFDAATRSLVLRHLGAMIARVQSYFAQHQDAHLEKLRGHFFERVDSRTHSAHAQNLRTAGVMLDKQAGIFNDCFQTALREAIEDDIEAVLPGSLRILRPAGSDDSTGPSSMALLDVDEIERHLLVDRVAQKFNNRYEAQLKALTTSVAALLRQDEFDLADNPFRPGCLLRAFLMAWHGSDFDPAAAEDFVGALEPDCSIDWAPLYADLTAMLVRAGFSANTVHRIRRTVGGDSGLASLGPDSTLPSGAPSSFGGLPPAGAPAAGGDAQGMQGMARTIASHARQFLNKLGFGGPDAGSGGASGGGNSGAADGRAAALQTPADPALMGFLGGLQAGAGTSQFPDWARGQEIAGQNLLRQMRESEEVRRAPELDRGTVDALAEVFDYVFADKSIPLQLKFVIGRLQIPVLKAAIIDRDFFLSNAHPARRLVDALAAAAVGWTPEMGETDPLYQQIDTTVKRVLGEFDDDLALFRELLAAFERFVQDRQQQAELRIEPAANQEQQNEAREAALKHADGVVHQCIHAIPPDQPLQPFLLPFLTTQWREVMARAWMQSDTEAARWDQALKTMDQVIWSTRARFQADERARLMAMLPDLVPRLDTSLDAIGWSGPERDEFTKRLIACHMKAIRTPKAGPPPPDTGPGELETQASREAIRALDKRVAPVRQRAADQFDAIAQGLERGNWFEFEHEADQLRRYRLGWISPQRTRMLFTNRDGHEAFVRSQREVAAMLREGRLTIIDQQPIVARAIEVIMAQE